MTLGRCSGSDHCEAQIAELICEHGWCSCARSWQWWNRPAVHRFSRFPLVTRWGHGGTTANRFIRKMRFPRSDGAATVAAPQVIIRCGQHSTLVSGTRSARHRRAA